MTVLEQVRDLIVRQRGEAICDDCIANELGLSVRQHANRKTNELKSKPGFSRRKDNCLKCGGFKLVISCK